MVGFVVFSPIVKTTSCFFIIKPEGNEADNDMGDSPGWVPRFEMVVSDGKADLLILLEAAVFGGKHYIRRHGRISIWADNFSAVVSTLIIVVEAKDYKVPYKWIFWIWSTDVIVDDLTVLFNLAFEVFLDLSRFSLESHI